jgi:hypothetical protein
MMLGRHRPPGASIGLPASGVEVAASPDRPKKDGLSSSFKKKFLSSLGRLGKLKGG